MMAFQKKFMQAKGATLVSVACHEDCKLAKMCEMSVYLPLQRELCPFDLAPVTSTALQMLFGDTVAIALMQASSTPRKFESMSSCFEWIRGSEGLLRGFFEYYILRPA